MASSSRVTDPVAVELVEAYIHGAALQYPTFGRLQKENS